MENNDLNKDVYEAAEKAAKECADSFVLTDFYMGSDIKEAIMEAFIAGANWQKEQSPWINVEERLPGIDELVLCQMESNYAIVSGYIFINEAGNPQVATDPSFEFEDYNDYKPTKWMPIPE